MLKGVIYLLLAEFTFAISSVTAKFALQGSQISGLQIVFFRFVFGTIVGYYLLKRSGESFKPNNVKLVLYRSIFNTASAMFFFYALAYTTVTNTNMLSMTYPLWIVLFAPLVLHEKFRKRNIIFVMMAMVGVYLVVHPNFASINIGDITAFLSGVCAAFSVIALRQARMYDSTNLIIFYLMFSGLLTNLVFIIPIWVNPTPVEWVFIILTGLLGLGAQFFITYAYKYIEATKGSLVSSTRIVMAGILGVIFFSDKITVQIIAGAALILVAQYGVIGSQLAMVRTWGRRLKNQ